MRASPLVEPLEDGRYRVTVSQRDGDGWRSRSYEAPAGAALGDWFTTIPAGCPWSSRSTSDCRCASP